MSDTTAGLGQGLKSWLRDSLGQEPREPAPESRLVAPPWISQPGALARNEASNVSDAHKALTRDIINNGYCIVRGAIAPRLCQHAISDYQRYVMENAAYVMENLDDLGREKRLVNFHRWSSAAMEIGANPDLMTLLDHLFGMETCVYTSLTFKYGTQQPIHRDTPHFATWPQGYFFGMWVALEDVDETAGPLMVQARDHHYSVDQLALSDELGARHPELDPHERMDQALDTYNGVVLDKSRIYGEPQLLPVKQGDVIIWHPELPHGGSPAKDPMHTRWSIVYHVAPVAVQVHQHRTFFSHRGAEPPADRYGYETAFGRKVAVAGGVAYM